MADDDNLSLEEMAAEEAAASSTAAIDSTPEPKPESSQTADVHQTVDEPEQGAEEPQPSNRAVVDWFVSQGEEWASKYQDDSSLLSAIPHMARKIREHDDDATWARQFTPQQRAAIEAQLAKQATQQPQNADPEPPYQEGWEDIVRAGNPPRDIVDKLNAHRAWLGRQILKQVRNPEDTIGKIVDRMVSERLKTIEERTGEISQTFAQRQREQAVNGWISQHRAELYTETNAFTPLAEEVNRLFASNPTVQDIAGKVGDVAAFDYALMMAKAKIPVPKTTKPIPKGAIREPAIATGGEAPKTPEELLLEQIDALPDEMPPGDYTFAEMLAKASAG